MAAERKVIDIDDSPELLELVHQVRRSNEPVVLREGGEDQATIEPPRRAPGEPGRLTESERRAFRATGGAWKGLVDGEQFLRGIEEGRRMPPRPLPAFDE
ncbi:MAG: hypothetical protein IT336_13260 [Thermomicrobiales bacterium]|nr:hypothetical protein [Thermomicrobiales bacterium]